MNVKRTLRDFRFANYDHVPNDSDLFNCVVQNSTIDRGRFFDRCEIANSTIKNGRYRDTKFIDCVFDGDADIDGCEIVDSRIIGMGEVGDRRTLIEGGSIEFTQLLGGGLKICETDLKDVVLSGVVELESCKVSGSLTLKGCDSRNRLIELEGDDESALTILNGSFSGCTFRVSRLAARFDGVFLKDCTIDESDLRGASWLYTNRIHCQFVNSDLRQLRVQGGRETNCSYDNCLTSDDVPEVAV